MSDSFEPEVWPSSLAHAREQIVAQRAEIERLTALVMEACNEIDELGFPGKADQLRRRALEPKP